MKTFRNINYTKRNYECTNIVFCQGEIVNIGANWIECDAWEITLMNCRQLYIIDGVRYFGYL